MAMAGKPRQIPQMSSARAVWPEVLICTCAEAGVSCLQVRQCCRSLVTAGVTVAILGSHVSVPFGNPQLNLKISGLSLQIHILDTAGGRILYRLYTVYEPVKCLPMYRTFHENYITGILFCRRNMK